MDIAVNRSLEFVAAGQYDSATISLHAAKSMFATEVLSRVHNHCVARLDSVIHKLITCLVENQVDDSVDINVFRFSAASLISDIILQLIRSGFVEASKNCCLKLCEFLANAHPARESEHFICIMQ